MRGQRIAEVRDPGRAGRPLHRGAQQMERRRRRGGEHDVDPLATDEPNRNRQREGAPRDVLVRDEETAAEKRRLRPHPREPLLVGQPLGGTAAAGPDVAHPVDPRLCRQLELGVRGRRARHVRREHVGLDPERRQVRRELERPLDAAAARWREVERHDQDLHGR